MCGALTRGSRRSRRWVAICWVIGGSIAAWLAYELWTRQSTEQRYRDAVAEADRLDPGWRDGILPEAREEIPDDENSAMLVMSTYEKIPSGWQALKGQWPPLELGPRQPIAPKLLTALKDRRAEAKDALADARGLAARPRGRFPDWRAEMPRSVPMARRQVETVSQLLYIDALIRIDEGDLAGAAHEIKAIVNAGRALGNDPMPAAQVGRVTAIVTAVATLQRLLARGELPADRLAELQKLMEAEARHPMALVSLRGTRAAVEKLFEDVRSGRASVAALFNSPSRSMPGILYSWRNLRENQTLHLAHTTRMVELARRPAQEQGRALDQYGNLVFGQTWNNSGLINQIYLLPFRENFRLASGWAAWQSRHHVALNLAVLALASERFRLEHGRWPRSLAELVPAYVEAVPYDPYTGGPLFWKPLGQRLVIYSAGPDGIDGGGDVSRFDAWGFGKDVGFVLELPQDRRWEAQSRP
jgi:hypothetical protein